MKAFRDLSIRRKLTWILTLTSSTAVLLVCLALLVYDRLTFQEAMVQNLETVSEMIGANTAAALMFDSPADAAQILASLKADEQIVAAVVYRQSGQVFATYHRSQRNFVPPAPRVPGHRFGAESLDLFRAILLEEESVGLVYIRSDLEALYARQARYIALVSGLLLGLGGILLVITSRLQRIISGPILRLASLARRVSTEKDYAARAQKDTQDEVGDLIDAFNEMLSEIHQRGLALEQANDALETRVSERTLELETANAQLRQSQKMEAIGQLAGGVAHDFNNQLAIIQGYMDMVLNDLPADSKSRDRIIQVTKAIERSTGLTQQLLLFSSRQPVEMRPIDLNRHIEELQSLMKRLIGEDIELRLVLSEEVWTVNADPSNLDQVVTNLFVNARDAMPEGGIITVETEMVEIDPAYCQKVAEAKPGHFIKLSVSDMGVGMSEEVRARVFEPFFTTKGSGRGTGLGLSVVYGIVQSHGGWITMESLLGKGTRFDIFLNPAEEAPRVSEHDSVEVDLEQFEGQGQRILLVEDERDLGEMGRQLLTDRGYQVQVCYTVEEARRAFQESDFDLVLSDVVLPDGRGPDLVLDLVDRKPSLGALLVTGYTDGRSDRERIRQAGLVLLQKPVPIAVLLEEVHSVLMARSAGPKQGEAPS